MMLSVADGYWVHGWGWPGIVVMVPFMIMCVVMMARMLGHGMHGRGGHSSGERRDAPERVLENRLARGEIDADEYDRLLEILQRPTHANEA
jgi:putative membrane protein